MILYQHTHLGWTHCLLQHSANDGLGVYGRQYNLVSMALNSFGVQLDEDLNQWKETRMTLMKTDLSGKTALITAPVWYW